MRRIRKFRIEPEGGSEVSQRIFKTSLLLKHDALCVLKSRVSRCLRDGGNYDAHCKHATTAAHRSSLSHFRKNRRALHMVRISQANIWGHVHIHQTAPVTVAPVRFAVMDRKRVMQHYGTALNFHSALRERSHRGVIDKA